MVNVLDKAAREAGSALEMRSRVLAPPGSLATQKPASLVREPSPVRETLMVSGATRRRSGEADWATLIVRVKTGVAP